MQEIQVCFSVDVDAVCGWLGSYGGADSPSDIQRGVFAGEVGVRRLLDLFHRSGIKTTWFIPGHSIETFPDETAAVHAAGHEIAAHGYSHENPIAMSRAQEEEVLLRSIELIEQVSGKRPRGYNAPWWEMSGNTAELLLNHGFLYDHSQMYNDFELDYARAGDRWTKINYSEPASTWMKPMVRGPRIDLVEICSNWYLDDLPPMMFIKSSPNSHGFVSPRDLESMWQDQFTWVHREMDSAVFPITIHPDVSGHPQVLLMLERFIEFVNGHDRVVWKTLEDVAAEFRAAKPFSAERSATTLDAQ